jgi:hypothetical protein
MGVTRQLQAHAATAISAVLVLAAAVLMGKLIVIVGQVKAQRTDLAELHDIKYGLLDADVWVEHIAAILGRKIDAFDLTEIDRSEIRDDVALVLDRLIVEVDGHLRQRNHEGPLHERLTGAVRQMIQDALVDVGELRGRVPAYADAILDELDKPEPKRKLQTQLAAMLRDVTGTTFARTDRSGLEAVIARDGCVAVASCEARLAADAAAGEGRAVVLSLALAGLVASVFGLCLHRGGRLTLTRMAVLTCVGVVLMIGGLATPMIDIDARIAELRFDLLGEPVVFRDQVLYFQSKSIFDVVSILARSGAADMALVAFLVVLFSVCFPLLKVAAGFVYLTDWRGLRRVRSVRFFALQSGKWSMADVLVVAIFMAYVGFSGLVDSQLRGIVGTAAGLDILTTNGTALQPGFYLFLGFVLASLLSSHMLANSVEEGGGPSGAVT